MEHCQATDIKVELLKLRCGLFYANKSNLNIEPMFYCLALSTMPMQIKGADCIVFPHRLQHVDDGLDRRWSAPRWHRPLIVLNFKALIQLNK